MLSSFTNTVREAGVQYLMMNLDDLMKIMYLYSMSRHLGTWADHIIIQEVADVMNLKIHIIESDYNFRDMTLVEPSNSTIENTRPVYVGHIGQSTLCVNTSSFV